jgi:hypothetical protein
MPKKNCFLPCLIFQPWRWMRYVFPKRRLTFNGLHGTLHNHRCENPKCYRIYLVTFWWWLNDLRHYLMMMMMTHTRRCRRHAIIGPIACSSAYALMPIIYLLICSFPSCVFILFLSHWFFLLPFLICFLLRFLYFFASFFILIFFTSFLPHVIILCLIVFLLFLSVSSLLSLFWKNKSKLMKSRCCLCVCACVCVSPNRC